jgi:ubiquinone/menaquinone biosynthesis C-methylase UbiE
MIAEQKLPKSVFSEVNKAFTKQSTIYDKYEEHNTILAWMRNQVHKTVLSFLKKDDNILELNSGTGTDAVFFAKKGFKVLATDLSDGMIEKIELKVNHEKLSGLIDVLQCSYTELDRIKNRKFDFIFSNFGGLNCVSDLNLVTKHFPLVLKNNGIVCLVIMPPVCPWEIVQLLRGKIKFAFRRFNKSGLSANVEGVSFYTYYFSHTKIMSALGPNFKLLKLMSLGVFTPIPQMEKFQTKFPQLLRLLNSLDEITARYFPFNRIGDHIIVIARYSVETKN